MAPTIVASNLFTAVNVSQQTITLPAATGDGYTLIVVTNNGVAPYTPTSPTLFWTNLGHAGSISNLANGELCNITVFHAPFICFPNTPRDQGSCSGEVVTINFTGQNDAVVTACLAITGTATFFRVGLSFDRGVINGPIYFVGNSVTQPAPLTFSTNDYNDLSICINVSDQGSLSNNVPTGYTGFMSGGIYGNNLLHVSLGYKSLSASQNNVSWDWGVLSGFSTSAVEFAYTDGTGGTLPSQISAIQQPLRRTKLINSVIGR